MLLWSKWLIFHLQFYCNCFFSSNILCPKHTKGQTLRHACIRILRKFSWCLLQCHQFFFLVALDFTSLLSIRLFILQWYNKFNAHSRVFGPTCINAHDLGTTSDLQTLKLPLVNLISIIKPLKKKNTGYCTFIYVRLFSVPFYLYSTSTQQQMLYSVGILERHPAIRWPSLSKHLAIVVRKIPI